VEHLVIGVLDHTRRSTHQTHHTLKAEGVFLMAKHSVLCVDDDSGIRKLYQNVLGTYGYHVSVASSGRQAMKMFLSRKVDAVLTDLEMPHMTGAELAKRLKHLRPQLPVLLVSGSKSALAAPPSDVDAAIAKGTPVSELASQLERLIAQRKRGDVTPRRLLPLGSILASIALVAYAVPRLWP